MTAYELALNIHFKWLNSLDYFEGKHVMEYANREVN
jgi:hypothetical protein